MSENGGQVETIVHNAEQHYSREDEVVDVNFFYDLLSVSLVDKLNRKRTSIVTSEMIEISASSFESFDKYTEENFLKMLEAFKRQQMLPIKQAMKLLNDAMTKLSELPNILEISQKSRKTLMKGTIIVGDLHGSFRDLYYILKQYGVPGKDYYYVFNGDYVDRGAQQCEVLLTLLYAFLLNPTRTCLNRGNHEEVLLNYSNKFHNFKDDCERAFGKSYGMLFFKEAHRVFQRLPIATIVENNAGLRVFVVHGGVSDLVDLTYVQEQVDRFKFSSIRLDPEHKHESQQLVDLLWSDPITRDNPSTQHLPSARGCFPNTRGMGCFFGADVSESFCHHYGFDYIVRSHESRMKGFSQDHDCVFTIFSVSHYMGMKNKGAVLKMPSNKHDMSVHTFQTYDDNDKKQDILLKKFLDIHLKKNGQSLRRKLERADAARTGLVEQEIFAEILSKHIFKKRGILLESRHIVAVYKGKVNNDKLDYAKVLTHSRKHLHVHDCLREIFELMDIEQRQELSTKQVRKMIKRMNDVLGKHYKDTMITNMTTQTDGVVNFDDFVQGFEHIKL